MTSNALFVFLLLLTSILQFVESGEGISLFPGFPIAALFSKNDACRKDSELYVSELKQTTMWAAKMWDATAKSTEGVLTGTIYQMGDFHECIETQAPFKTQYCLVTIMAHFKNDSGSYKQNQYYPNNNNFTTILERITAPADRSREPKNYVRSAWCVPASCLVADLDQTLTVHLRNVNTSLSSQGIVYTATLSKNDCQINQSWTTDVMDITFCALTIILIILVITATTFDYYYMEKTGCHLSDNIKRIMIAFSARKNLTTLSKLEQHDSLVVLHGIKTVSCLVVIIMHRFAVAGNTGNSKHLDYFENVYGGKHPLRFILYHPDVLVDTFFTLSGILTAHSVFRSLKANKSTQACKLLFFRYMRLTPVYAYVLFYYATLFNLTGSGPLWKSGITTQRELCRENWYLNLLYVHNYFGGTLETLCMIHTWSLACDFHFFIVGLLVCLVITYNKKAGVTLLFAVTTASVVATFLKIYIEERTAILLTYPNLIKDPEFEATYIKTHLRAAPYFIGLYFGYLINCKSFDTIKRRMNVIKSVIIFISSLAILAAVVFSAANFYNQNREYSALESATYGALNRAVWSIGIVGIIFVTICGSISLLDEILSWKVWIPFSKLTYAAYIIHFQFQLRSVAMATSPIDFFINNLILEGARDCFYAFAAGLFLYLVVEMPFRKIVNIFLFDRRIKSKECVLKDNAANDSVIEKVKQK